MASPPSPLYSSPKPISTVSTTTSPSKRSQPSIWTHEETVQLLRAYREKWFSLRRGQLKTVHWEDVASAVAGRCGHDYSRAAKTATQCRHKMEKLRQRYGKEKLRAEQIGYCYWPYFSQMSNLERDPLPISARPVTAIRYHNNGGVELGNQIDDDGGTDEDDEEEKDCSRLRSINYILQRPTIVNRFAREATLRSDGKPGGGIVSGSWRKRSEPEEEEEEVGEMGMEERERGRKMFTELAVEIRDFSKRYVGMENMKLEMMRETERCRMEMEKKRMEMIAESRQKIIDSIAMAFGSPRSETMGEEL